MDQNSRNQVLFDFKKQIARIMVATDVAGLKLTVGFDESEIFKKKSCVQIL